MTVEQLRRALAKAPPDAEVWIMPKDRNVNLPVSVAFTYGPDRYGPADFIIAEAKG